MLWNEQSAHLYPVTRNQFLPGVWLILCLFIQSLFVSKHTIHSNMNPGQNEAVTGFSISRCSSYSLDRTTTRSGICCWQRNGQKGSDALQSKTVSTTSKNQSSSWCVVNWPPHVYPPRCFGVGGACSLPMSHSFYTASSPSMFLSAILHKKTIWKVHQCHPIPGPSSLCSKVCPTMVWKHP